MQLRETPFHSGKGTQMKRLILTLGSYLLLGAAAGWAQPGQNGQNSQPPQQAAQTPPQQGAQTPATGQQAAYAALPDETSLPIENLLDQADALAADGQSSRAIALYDRVLIAAPRNPQAYQGRARALMALGDTAQAQADYNRFLTLDPQAGARTRQELELFERSGYQSPGEMGMESPSQPGPAVPQPGAVVPQPTVTDRPQGSLEGPRGAAGLPWDVRPPVVDTNRESREVVRADLNFAFARSALRDGDTYTALRYAGLSELAVPRVRNRVLMAQAYLAQGDYAAAVTEARAVAVAGPLDDWQTIYGYYDFSLPRFVVAVRRLEQYVRLHPASADAHFLLGYEYFFGGQTESAHEQIAIASVLQPLDRVAKSLLDRQGVEVTTTAMPSPMGLGAVTRLPVSQAFPR